MYLGAAVCSAMFIVVAFSLLMLIVTGNGVVAHVTRDEKTSSINIIACKHVSRVPGRVRRVNRDSGKHQLQVERWRLKEFRIADLLNFPSAL